MIEDMGASLRDRATTASQSNPQAVSSTAGIPSADDPRLERRKFGLGDHVHRPKSISKADRDLLRSFSDPILARIKGMADDELWAFIDAGNHVSVTNCGWDEYAIAKVYLDGAQWEMRRRLRAIAIEARSDATGTGAAEGESAGRQASPEHQSALTGASTHD